ncbi:hypothetical protein K7B10_36740 [Streptomyces flavotricini]|uniref:Uncharacterized protein n=1 Tax=Streptomyces flavotricini TaxID=66888 RepID=A0ABS8EGT6_9ACTN|nr:hypothetical protein [Streptomyces flavotricini]MCC0100232.1 hypothetical protein [Streptomyces flavotricini]
MGESTMCTTYWLRISRAGGAAPETAAVRLIAGLPAHWGASLLSCTRGSATLALTPPAETSPEEVSDVVDAVLATPALRGWVGRLLAAHEQQHLGEKWKP